MHILLVNKKKLSARGRSKCSGFYNVNNVKTREMSLQPIHFNKMSQHGKWMPGTFNYQFNNK